MSKQVDERVVEMQFDNSNFEKNVSQSLSTLEKLKQRLNLTGASKGLENLNSAANKVNMSGLGGAVDAVSSRFSAMEIIGVTALANITNQAVNAGKRMLSALTLDPVKTGFQEYETQINAVQTILANTSSKGSTIKDVNKALDELNKYADKTIYNFTEMTRNIGTFTAAGIELDTSVPAIQGIANLAAVSGSTSQQASTAMYQLSQALAAGTVKLMDWNSVVNAGMGGEVFQNALKRTATVMGTNVDALIKKAGSFRESLKDGWITSEVLTKTLEQFTMAAAEGSKEWNTFKKSLMDEGYTEDQANEILKMANTATDAATKVKTFTQLWDVMKESAQSGWSQTWKIIIGDFEEAKSLLTPVADFMTNIINTMSDARNKIVEKAMGSPLGNLVGIINRVKGDFTGVAKTVDTVTKTLDNLDDVVNKVIKGEFGNMQERWDKLAEAGYNWAEVQNKVNEKLGSSVRHNTKLGKSQDKIIENQDKLNKKRADTLVSLIKMSDAELKAIGLNKQQINALRELEEQSEKTGIPLEKLAEDLSLLEGRSLLFNGLGNAGKAVVAVFEAMATAWNNVFPSEKAPEKIYDLIAAFHKFTTTLEVNEETSKKFVDTFQGVFSLLHLVTSILNGGVKLAFRILNTILEKFDMNLLDVTASIGKWLTKLDEWVTKNEYITKAVDIIAEAIVLCIDKIREWAKEFYELEFVQNIISNIRGAFNDLKNLSFEDIGYNIVAGLQNGIAAGIKMIPQTVIDVCMSIWEGFCNFFQIKSPSRLMMTLGGFIVAGLVIGLLNGVPAIGDALKSLLQKIVDIFKNFNFVDLVKSGSLNIFDYFKGKFSSLKNTVDNDILVGFVDFYLKTGDKIKAGLKKFGEIVEAVVKFIFGTEELSLPVILDLTEKILTVIALFKLLGILDNLTGGLSSIGEGFNNIAASMKWKAIGSAFKGLAIALGAMTLCLIVIDDIAKDGTTSTRAFGILMGILLGMGAVIGTLMFLSKDLSGKFDLITAVGSLLGFSVALGILVFMLKKIDDMTLKDASGSLFKMVVILLAMAGYMKLVGKACGEGTLKSAAAILTMVAAVKMILNVLEDYADFPWTRVEKGLPKLMQMMLGLALVLRIGSGGLKSGSSAAGLAGLMISIVISLKIMLGVIEDLGNMNPGKMWQGISGLMIVLAGITTMLVAINLTNKGGILEKGQKNVNSFTGLAAALLATAVAIMLLGKLETSQLLKGGTAIVTILGMFSLLMWSMGKAGSVKMSSIVILLVGFGLIVGEIAYIVHQMSGVDWKNAVGSTSSISILLGAISACMITLNKNKIKTGNMSKWIGVILLFGAVIAELGLIITVMQGVDGVAAIPQVMAISMLLGTMSGILVLLNSQKSIKPVLLPRWIKMLALLGLVVGELALTLGLMQGVDGSNAIGQATAISILLGVMSGCLVALNAFPIIKTNIGTTILAIAGLGLVVAGIAGVLYLIKDVDGNNMIKQVDAISKLLLAISACLVICSAVGFVAGPALAGLGTLMIALAGLTAFVAGMGKLESLGPLMDKGIDIMSKLGEAIGAFLGGIAKGAIETVSSALPQLGKDLGAFASYATPFFIWLKILDAEDVQKAGFLTAIIGALGAAGFINGIANVMSLGQSLPNLGRDLSKFMENAKGFFTGLEGVNAEAVTSAKTVAEILKVLAQAQLTNLVTEILSFGTADFDEFGKVLENFGEAVVKFSNILTAEGNAVDSKAVETAVKAGQLIATLYDVIPKTGGWWQDIIGVSDMKTFGQQISAFGLAIISFSNQLKTEGNAIDEAAVSKAVEAGKLIATLYDVIPKTGGLWQDIAGVEDIKTLGTQMVAFVGSVISVSNKLKGVTIDESGITATVNAGKLVAELYKVVPKTGGAWQYFAGVEDLQKFGAEISAFATAIIGFENKVKDNGGISASAISAAVNAGLTVAKLYEVLPEDESWLTKIINGFTGGGKMTMTEFGDMLAEFGGAIVKLQESLVDVDPATLTSTVTNIKTLFNTMKQMEGFESSSVDGFTAAIKKLAESGISDLVAAFSDESSQVVNAINGMITSLTTSVINGGVMISTAFSLMLATIVAGIMSKSTSFTTAGLMLMTGLANSVALGANNIKTRILLLLTTCLTLITSTSPKFQSAGFMLMTLFSIGIVFGSVSLSSTVSTIISGIVSTIEGFYDSMYSAGEYLGDGLIAGINSKQQAAYDAGFALGQAAVQGEKDGQASNSPSKATIKAGKWFGEGLVIGIGKMTKAVGNAGTSLGETAVNSVSNTIDKIAAAINSDIDTQPTIRPVVDLSGISSSVGAINGMFNLTPSLSAVSNVRSISSMMNNQNGSNNDVVSELKKLNKNIGNVGGNTTNNIGSVSYNDDSSITSAVKEIVKAARVERRR